MEPTEVSRRGYYCHKCQTTISIPSTEFACPDCNDGFIEKLSGPSADAQAIVDQHRVDPDAIPMRDNIFSGFFLSGSDSILETGSDNRPSSSNRREVSSDTRRPRNQNFTGTFEHVLSEFLNTVTRPNTGNMETNPPVFFLSNPGDYAWGREGLDTIVTQLLNQMDSSGPPPLAKDKIKELPYVPITAEHVSENIQCSVCWDSFKICENVRQLPCEHIYHDLCIVPWLELHGTCPICRKLLCEDNENRLGFSHSGGLEALLRAANRTNMNNGGSNSSSSSSSGGSSSSSSSSSSNSSFGSAFLEFD